MLRIWLPLRVVRGHPRLFIAAAAGFATELLLPGSMRLATRLLIDWNVGVWLYVVTVGVMIARASPQSMRRRARISDEGRVFILLLTSLAALASIAAIVAQLAAVKDLTGVMKGLHVGLAGLTIVSAWLFIDLTFALHMRMNFSMNGSPNPDGHRPTMAA